MALVDLAKNRLLMKVLVAGPPQVGKTNRLDQVGAIGRRQAFGSGMMGPTEMAVLPLDIERQGRPVHLELYEWHGPEKADVRAKGLFVGVDGLVYLADAREDRYVDSIRVFQYLVESAGKSKVQRLPAMLLLGRMDEGLLRLSAFEDKLLGPTWSEKIELAYDSAEPFIEALRVYGEVMLARAL